MYGFIYGAVNTIILVLNKSPTQKEMSFDVRVRQFAKFVIRVLEGVNNVVVICYNTLTLKLILNEQVRMFDILSFV